MTTIGVLTARIAGVSVDGDAEACGDLRRLLVRERRPREAPQAESRLILLKRRLDEREAPIRIEKAGRGRFRLLVGTLLTLDEVR